jgi:hypothetical protein
VTCFDVDVQDAVFFTVEFAREICNFLTIFFTSRVDQLRRSLLFYKASRRIECMQKKNA